jgi:DNA-binding CsgD family transcriptional regulator
LRFFRGTKCKEMKELTFRDTQQLLQAVYHLQSLKNLDTFERDSLSIVAQLVPTEASAICTCQFDFSNFSERPLEKGSSMQALEEDFERLLEELTPTIYHYADQNPLLQYLPLTTKGTHKFSDFVDIEEFQDKEGYQAIMKPIGIDDVASMIIYDFDCHPTSIMSTQVLRYVLYRPWQKFTERDRLVLNLLQPHLIQAHQTVRHFQDLQQEVTKLQQSLDRTGVIFLDGLGRVKLMTSQAAKWLQSYFPSNRGFRQLPEKLDSWVKHQLNRSKVAEDDVSSPCLPLHLQQKNRQLTIRLVADQPGEQYLLLLAEEQMLSWLAALELLGLSQREAEVLSSIIQGQDNKAIALQMKINISTVRKHLENIYRKLGVKNRTEAIASALEKLGCLNSSPFI